LSDTRPRAGIFGAHSAIGRAIIECVEERELELELVPATDVEHLGEGLELMSEALFDRAELWVLAIGGEAARLAGQGALAKNKPVLDLGGELESDPAARLVWPILEPAALAKTGRAEIAVIATGLAGPVVAALRALGPLGIRRVHLVALESAAIADQPGMDRLSEESRAVFTLKEPESEPLFGERLAFNLVPERLDDDRRLARQIAAGVGAPELAIHVARVIVPSFSAEGAILSVEWSSAADEAQVAAALRGARGLRYIAGPAPAPAASEALERDDALVGRLRMDSPERASLWIASDRLRHGSATPAVLLLEQWLASPK
jgi:aspartate-semialdehyde dehydrogenase